MFCPACGVKNEEDVVKCFICGKVMPGVFESPKDKKQAIRQPKRGRVVDPTAALGDRMLAMILDSLLLGVVIAGIALMVAHRWDLIPHSIDSLSKAEASAAGALAAIVMLLYFWILEGLFGATLGKSLIGIKVQGTYGDPPSMRESLIRTLFRLIDGVGFYFVGFVVAIFSKRRQRIGDYAAGTVVVNEPPSTAARAGVLVLWLALIAGLIFGVWKTVEPAREWVDALLMQRSVGEPSEQAPAPPTELTLDDFAWLAAREGPVVEVATFKPGDRVWARYEIIGFGRDEGGGVNILTESSAVDPSGASIARPEVSTTLEVAPDTRVERVDRLEIPNYAPGGPYEFQIRARDMSRGRDATFVQRFEVEASDIAPATVLEVRNFVFSMAENGFPLDEALFDVGETVHYRFEIFGLQFIEDRIDAVTSYKFIGPEGRAIYATPKWRLVQESHRYHPSTFFVVQSGSVSLPSDARSGDYILEHIVTDTHAKLTARHVAQFKLR